VAKRTIQVDPDEARQKSYSIVDGDALSALWEYIENLSANGIDVGPKCLAMLEVRRDIKQKAPKP
jgi:hypothetical protein